MKFSSEVLASYSGSKNNLGKIKSISAAEGGGDSNPLVELSSTSLLKTLGFQLGLRPLSATGNLPVSRPHPRSNLTTGSQKRIPFGTRFWIGGGGEIRTHDTPSGIPHFECGALDHSATPPHWKN